MDGGFIPAFLLGLARGGGGGAKVEFLMCSPLEPKGGTDDPFVESTQVVDTPMMRFPKRNWITLFLQLLGPKCAP